MKSVAPDAHVTKKINRILILPLAGADPGF